MSTIGRIYPPSGDYAEPERWSVGRILRVNGPLLVVGLILVSGLTFVAYAIFDFDLIWVVAVPLIAAGLSLGALVAGAPPLDNP